jgi:ribosomal protein S18 acetylase RimI-like enzyme/predicted HTH domain antitoxin
MSDHVRLSSEPAAPASDVARIIGAIEAWNMDVTGVRDYRPIAIFLRDGAGAIRGGVTGGVWGGWLHVVALWVDEPLRGRGHGRSLLAAAEAEAVAAGARHAFLETHTFQAPELYRRLGYTLIAEIEEYPPGERQLILRKELGVPVTIDALAPSDPDSVLRRLERYYDTVPRAVARTEEIGPFTLFVATTGYPFYARPRLGLTGPIDAEDVSAVRERQRELGVPEAIEWVVQTTPSLSDAARAAGLSVEELPLLVLDRPLDVPLPAGITVRRIAADEPDLERIMAVAAVAFGNGGTAVGAPGPAERDALAATSTADRARLRQRIATGAMVMVVAEGATGPVASGVHQPVADTTEVVGVATLPSARRRGIGAAVTAALVADAVAGGLDLVFLSAAGEDVARIYERLGFRRVALAGIAEAPAPDTAPATG